MKLYTFNMWDSLCLTMPMLQERAERAAIEEAEFHFQCDEGKSYWVIESVQMEGLPVSKDDSVIYQFSVYGEIKQIHTQVDKIADFNKRLENLETDLNTLKVDKFHPKHLDLLNMVLLEDVPELIKLVKKVNSSFEGSYPEGTGPSHHGAKQEWEILKRQIYGT